MVCGFPQFDQAGRYRSIDASLAPVLTTAMSGMLGADPSGGFMHTITKRVTAKVGGPRAALYASAGDDEDDSDADSLPGGQGDQGAGNANCEQNHISARVPSKDAAASNAESQRSQAEQSASGGSQLGLADGDSAGGGDDLEEMTI